MKIVLRSCSTIFLRLMPLFLLLLSTGKVLGQTCDPKTPYHYINMTGNPDSIWVGPSESREGYCCGGGKKDNDPCVEFLVLLDKGSQGIRFFVAEGAKPSGALDWQLNCGPRYPVGEDICLNGPGPHKITFCKPGNNPNRYGIQSISKPDVSPPTVAADFCTGTLNAAGFQASTIKWNTIYPGTRGQYNYALSCSTSCQTILATYIKGLPYIDVEVSGLPVGGCSSVPVVLTTRVFFVDDKKVTIFPKNPTICFGGTYAKITASGTGGAQPYTYKWSNGATGAIVNAPSIGWYVVTMSDTTGCPPVKDSVYVTAYKSPITVNAGPDDTTCADSPALILKGSVQTATKGRWSGGAGKFTPNDSTLTATYTPSASEILAGKLKLILTTVDNGSCPSVKDTMSQFIVPVPVVNAGNDTTVCGNNVKVNLKGKITNAKGGAWSGGTGTYFPNNTTLSTSYTPSAAEITAKSATLTLTSTGNGKCSAVADQMKISITDAPTVEAGPDQTVCANKAGVQLNATYTIATGIIWKGGTGNFSDRNIPNPTYNPSTAEKTAGKVVLKATTTGSNKCLEVTDSLTIFITPAPIANAGPDLSVCENAPDVTLNGSVTTATGGEWITGAGTFGNKLSPVSSYKPTATEIASKSVQLVLRTTGNGNCIAVTDTMKIIISPAPVVDAGNPPAVCGNKSTIALAGTVTVTNSGQWFGGTGTFSPGRTTLATSYTPSPAEIAAGKVKLWLTSTNNNNCNPATDTTIISITPAPVVNAGTVQPVCENNAQVQLNGSFSVAGGVIWSGGAGSFSTSNTDPLSKYTPSPTEILNKTVTLTLTATNYGNCNPVSSSTTITITPKPAVNAGQDFSVCANMPGAKLQGTVSVATQGKWTGGGGKFTPDDVTLDALYTPSAAEITAGKVTLTLTSTDNGNCLPASDQVLITITKAPVANANIDQTVCANNSAVTLAGSVTVATGGSWSGGSGTLSSGSTLNPTYTPSQTEITAGFADLTLTTTGNGNCLAATDVMRVIITKAPVANAGIDQSVCANNPKVKLAATVTTATGGQWSLGKGNFSLSDTDLNATYTPTATEISAGQVTLRLTTTGNGNCIPVTDDIKITITPAPTADAGADRTVCGNNSSLALNGILTTATKGTWSGGTGSFSPDATTLTATYTPSATEITAGKAVLKLTTTDHGNCLAASDSMIITITPAPIADAGPDGIICSNNPSVSLNGSVKTATGGDWSGVAGNFSGGKSALITSYTPTASEISAGTVTFTLTTTGNGLCKPVTDQVKYTFTSAPEVNAGNDIPTCSNNPVVTLSGSYKVAGGVTWSGGAGKFADPNLPATTYSPTATEISNGTVTLTLTTTSNGKCLPVSDQVILTFTPSPIADAGADRTVCANNTTLALAGIVSVAPGGTWSGGTGNFSNNTLLTSTYNPSAAEITAGKATLTLTTNAVGNCLPVSDNMVITITTAPVVKAGTDQFVCGNNPDVNLNGSVINATGGKWISGGGTFLPDKTTLNAHYSPSAAEVKFSSSLLILESTGNGNCLPVRDTVLVIIGASPTAAAGKDTTACRNNPSVTLNGIATNATGRAWTGGAGSFSPNANTANATYTPSAGELAAGQVSLTFTATKASCTPVSDDMVIKFSPAPITDAGPDQTICSNNPKITLKGTVTTATGGTWSNGAGSWSPSPSALSVVYTPTVSEIQAGTLKLVFTSSGNGNCLAVSDTVAINFSPAPTALPGTPQFVCANKPQVQLNGAVKIASGGAWSGGNGGSFSPNNTDLKATYNPSAADKAAGFVYLRLTTTGNNNCIGVSDSVKITITNAPTADAGKDFDVCANNPKAQLTGVVLVSKGGTWTGGNGLMTPDADSLNVTYTPTGAEITAGKVTLTLVTTGNGNCNLVTDNITLTITPAPTIDAGPDQTVCGNSTGIQLNGQVTVATGGHWVSGGTGSFSPSPDVLNAKYIPSSADVIKGSVNITFTSTGNGKCVAVSDGLIVNFTTAPTINAGPDQTVCSNSFPVNLEATGSPSVWTGGNGIFAPGRNVLNPTYTPTQAEVTQGFVLLTANTIATGACPSFSDQVKINLKNGPVVNAGKDSIVCGDITSVKLNGVVTNAAGGTWTTTGRGSFKTSPSTLPGEYVKHIDDIKNSPVRFILTTTGNGLCSAETDTMFIKFTEPPVVNAGGDRTICADKKTIDLTGQVTVATGATWTTTGKGSISNPSALKTIYTFAPEDTVAKSVTFTLTSTGNGTCIPVSSVMKVTITPAPKVNAGTDQTICADTAQLSLKGTVTVATGGTWSSTGTGTFSPNNTLLTTNYFLNPSDTSLKTLKFVLTTSGNGTCNAVTDTVLVKINPVPVALAGSDQIICSDKKTIALSGKVFNATGGIWSGGAGSFNPQNALNTVYTLTSADSTAATVTLTLKTTGNGSCKPVTDKMILNLTPAPTINAGADQIVCANNALVKLAGKITIAQGATWSNGTGTYTPHPNSLSATYKPSAAEITAGKAVLVLTSTGNGNCNPVKDTLVIRITPSPVVKPGNTTTVCSDIGEVPLNGIVDNATGGTWTTSGNGYFTPSENLLNAKYVPSKEDTAKRVVTLTLTSQGNGNCLAVSSDMVLNLTPAPLADAGSPATICANNAQVQLAGKVTVATGGTWTGGAGSFNPSATDLNAVYTPSANEITNGAVVLTLTTTGMGTCKATVARKIITITPAPVVSAGPDLNVCENNPITTLNGSVKIATGVTWSGFNGIMLPGNTSLNPGYTLSKSEIINKSALLIITSTGNGSCKAVSDTVLIKVTPSPTADAGKDQIICSDSSAIILSAKVTGSSGLIWTTNGSGPVVPDANSASAKYIPLASDKVRGNITFAVTTEENGNCLAVSDSMTVQITPAPIVNAGSDKIVCANNSEIQLPGSVSVSTGGTWTGGTGKYTPDANSPAAKYTPSANEITAGIVNLKLSSTGNGSCKTASDNVTITITPAPIVNAGINKSVCANNPVVDLTGTISIASGGSWSGGSGNFSPSASSLVSTYTLSPAEITAKKAQLILSSTGNGNCKTVTDTIDILVTPAPVPMAGSDITICSDSSSVALKGTVSVATDAIWTSNGSGNFSPSKNGTSLTYTPSAADRTKGMVKLTMTTEGNGNCNAVSDTLNLAITPAPVTDAGTDQTICADASAVKLDGTVTVAAGGTWSGGTGTFSDKNNLKGNYIPSTEEIVNGTVTLFLTSVNNGSCKSVKDAVTVKITPAPTVNAGFNQIVCADAGAVTLTGNVKVATGGKWSTSGKGSFIPGADNLSVSYVISPLDTAAKSVQLFLETTGNGTCLIKRDTVDLKFTPVPIANAGNDKNVCADAGAVELLDATIYNASGSKWTSSGTGSFTPNSSDLHATYTPSADDISKGNVVLTLTASGNGTCNAASDNLKLTINPAPVVNAGVNDTICADASMVQLKGIVSVATGGIWSTGSGAGSFQPSASDLNATFLPDQSQINAGIATLILTTSGNGLCKPVTSRKFVIFKKIPVIDAGPNQTVCETNTSVKLNATVQNATSGKWTTSGNGSFTDANAITTTYNLTAEDKASGLITLKISSTGNGVCNSHYDSLLVKINKAPTVDAGPSAICSNSTGIRLDGKYTLAGGVTWSTNGSGTFDPSANISNPIFHPSSADLTTGQIILRLSTTGNGPCKAAKDSVILSITPVPTADAGVDQIICANAGDVQLSGKVIGSTGGSWTSSGGGSFTPGPGDLHAKYTPSAADILNGKATITLTTTGVGLCDPANDQMVIFVTPAPVSLPGSVQTVCADTSGIRLHGAVTVATGGTWTSPTGGTFTPSATDLNAVYHPTAADITKGKVQLTLTTTGNGNCKPVNRAVDMIITPAPTADAGTDQKICGDVKAIVFNGNTTVAAGRKWGTTGKGTLTPDSTSQYITYNITPADVTKGNLKLYFTTTGNGMCKPVSDTVALSITPAPTVKVAAGGICADKDSIQLNGKVTVATGVSWSTSGTGKWDPDTLNLNPKYIPSPADKAAKRAVLTVTTTGNGTCLPVSDSVVINISPAPVAKAGNDIAICAENNGVQLNGSVLNAGGLNWSTTGIGSFSSAGDGNAIYTPSAQDTAAHKVKLVLTTVGTGSCSPVTDTVLINFTPAPVVLAGPEIICSSSGVVNLSGKVWNATGLEWSRSGDGNFSGLITDAVNTYTSGAADIAAKKVVLYLKSTGNGICAQKTDSIVINMADAPIANAGGKDTICSDATIYTLNGSVINAGGMNWTTSGSGTLKNPGSANATYSPSTADTAAHSVKFALTTTLNGQCAAVTDSFYLHILPKPVVDAGPATICSDNPSVNLVGKVQHASGISWSSSAGANGKFVNPNALATDYKPGSADIAAKKVTLYLTSTNMGSCKAVTDSIMLNITAPPAPVAGAPSYICATEKSIQLSGIIKGAATGGHWTALSNGKFANADALNAVYAVTLEDTTNKQVSFILTTTGTGDCNPANDTVVVQIKPAPLVSAGNDQTVCADNAAVKLAGKIFNAGGSVWKTSGTGKFLPDSTAISSSYKPSGLDTAAGHVRLTLTSTINDRCTPASDSLDLYFDKVPFADAGPLSACTEFPAIPMHGIVRNASGVVWSTSGDGTFAPNVNGTDVLYIVSPNDTTIKKVTLTLTTTGNGACAAAIDKMDINLIPTPFVSAEASSNMLCADGVIKLSGTKGGTATGVIWNTNGNGNWTSGQTAENAVYTPSSSEAKTSTELELWFAVSTTGSSPCSPVSDTVKITITPAPVAIVNAGNDTTLCADKASLALNGKISVAKGGEWTTTGNGIFTPDAFTLNATYLADTSDINAGSVKIALSTIGNGMCNPVSDTVLLSFAKRPVATAGPDVTVCEDDRKIKLNGFADNAGGGRWFSSGSGGFDNDSSLTATYTVSTGDIDDSIIILTLETTFNGSCDAAFDNKIIYVRPAPVLDAGPDIIICADNRTITLTANRKYTSVSEWKTTGNGPISPSKDDATINYTVTNADTTSGKIAFYLNTPAADGCFAKKDSLFVTITDAPTAFAGNDQEVCADVDGISVSGKITAGTGGMWTSSGKGGFAPNATSLDAVYIPTPADTAAGKVTLTLETTGTGDCEAASNSTVITILPAPIINAGQDVEVCANAADVKLSGKVINATGGKWTGGHGSFATSDTDLNTIYTPSAEEIEAGTASLTLTSTGIGTCNPVSDQMTITITPAPVADAGSDVTVCSNNPEFALEGKIEIAGGGIWTGGNGKFNPGDSSLITTYIPTKAEISAKSLKLLLTTTGNGKCKAVKDSLQITFTDSPVVKASILKPICADRDSIGLSGTNLVAEGIKWSTSGSGSFAPSADQMNAVYIPSSSDRTAGKVSLILTSTGNGNCLAVSDTTNLIITPAPLADAGTDIVTCSNNPVIDLHGKVTFATGGRWNGGSGAFIKSRDSLNASYVPTPAEIATGFLTLNLETTGMGSCNPVTDQILIRFTDSPIISAGEDLKVCENNPEIQLSGTVEVSSGGSWLGGNGKFSDRNNLNTSYIPSAGEIKAGLVKLLLTSTGNGSCKSVSDSILVTITPAPFADAGTINKICADKPSVALNGNVKVAGGGLWSSDGGGRFAPDASSLSTSYILSDSDQLKDTVKVFLTTTANGNCLAVSDTSLILITPKPSISSGSDQIVCGNNPVVTLTGTVQGSGGGKWSGGSGSFTISSDSLKSAYRPSATEIADGFVTLKITSTNNGLCNAVNDVLNITITPSPVANAGADRTVCFNNADALLQGSVLVAKGGIWSGGSGSYNPSPASLVNTYTPTLIEKGSSPLTMTLTTTGNGNCLPANDQMAILIKPLPTVITGSNQTVCADVDSVFLSGTVTGAGGGKWTTSGSGYFTPDAFTLKAKYIPSDADRKNGNLSLTLTSTGNENCLPVSAFMLLKITPAPTVNAGNDITVCADSKSVQLSGKVTTATGGSWSTSGKGGFSNSGNLNSLYTLDNKDISDGKVILKLKSTGNGRCKEVSDNVTINITPAPSADAGTPVTVCADAEEVVLNGNVTTASGGTWSTSGTGSFNNSDNLKTSYYISPEDTLQGTVTLTLTTTGNGLCKAVKDSVTIGIRPAPVVKTSDASICSDFRGAAIKGMVFNATGVKWSGTGSGTFSPNVYSKDIRYTPSQKDLENGFVILKLQSEGHGTCKPAVTEMKIIVAPLPQADAGDDKTICRNSETLLQAKPMAEASFVWYTTGGTSIGSEELQLISTDRDTSFIVGITDAKGCKAYDTVAVKVTDPPVMTIADYFCFTEGLVIEAKMPLRPANGAFQWFRNDTLLFNENDTKLGVEKYGAHMIGYTFGNCSVYDTTQVKQGPVGTGLDMIACIGDSVYLNTTSLKGATYQWYRGNTKTGNKESIRVFAAGPDKIEYIVEITDSLKCLGKDTINVSGIKRPVTEISDVQSCIGNTVQMTAPAPLPDISNIYRWFGSNGDFLSAEQNLEVTKAGFYSLVYTAGNCVTKDSAFATFNPNPVAVNADTVKFCKDLVMTVTVDAGPATKYLWMESGSVKKDTLVDTEGYQFVRIFNEFNCFVNDSIYVKNVCPPAVYIPDAFTPDCNPAVADCSADRTFRVFGNNFKKFSLTIYNRWGEIIFYSEDPKKGWDGTYLGKPMPSSVYPYIVRYAAENEEFDIGLNKMTGTVVLIR